MSELAALVASGMGPGDVDDLLRDALGVMRELYGDGNLYSVTVDFSWCVHENGRGERKMSWRLQVNNDRGYGDSRLEALRELRANIDASGMVPALASRVADVLREIDDAERYTVDRVFRNAQEILERERRNR